MDFIGVENLEGILWQLAKKISLCNRTTTMRKKEKWVLF